MIDSVTLDNTTHDWKFEKPTTMNYLEQTPQNPATVLKDVVVKNIRVYWNSMSEMFVPTSLWEQTRHLKYQIFEAMDP